MNHKQEDPDKRTEEELKRLINELKQKENKRRTMITFRFMLHKEYAVHLVLSLAVNTLILAVVMGLSIGINNPLVQMENIVSFLFAAVLLTLIENLIKILLFRYAFRVIMYSLGLLPLMVTFLILYSVDMLLQDRFHFNNVLSLGIFTIGFTFFRLILSTYLRHWIYTKKISFIGGKK